MGQRQPCPEFVGGSGRLVARAANNTASINCFPETTGGGGKVQRGLRRVEGLRRFATMPGSDSTNCLFFQNERLFGAAGTAFAEIDADGNVTQRGEIAEGRATMASNGTAGNQVQIASGFSMYCFNLVSNSLVPVDIGETIGMVEFTDGYFLALIYATRQFRWSALEDGLTWPTLNVAERSWGSDNLNFLKRAGRYIYLIGNKTGEIWADVGQGNTTFAPLPGTFMPTGSVAPFAVCRDDKERLIWVSQNERGGGEVVIAKGDDPTKISTYPIDLMIESKQGGLSQAVGVCHSNNGHTFYWLNSLGLPTTPVLDLTEQEWSERAMWNQDTGQWEEHIVCSHAYAFEKHIVGVLDSPTLYELSFNYASNGV